MRNSVDAEPGHGRDVVAGRRACYDRNSREIIVDTRWDPNTIRARIDTMRGCPIGMIYALTEEDLLELQELGEVPGSRN